jgi:hypothetical protein
MMEAINNVSTRKKHENAENVSVFLEQTHPEFLDLVA